MTEQFQTGLKKPSRGMARASLDLIAEMYVIAKQTQAELLLEEALDIEAVGVA